MTRKKKKPEQKLKVIEGNRHDLAEELLKKVALGEMTGKEASNKLRKKGKLSRIENDKPK